jgi:hypothetical protein
MRAVIPAIVIGAVLGASGARAQDKCGGSDVKYYDQALIFHLVQQAVPYRLSKDGLVCVAGEHSAEFIAAEREVERRFHEVAHLLRDACEERAFVAWATKEKMRFDVRPVLNARNQAAGKMFLLRSFTHDEVVANGEGLANRAPKGATCR